MSGWGRRVLASEGRAWFQGLELRSRAVVSRGTEERVEVWGGGWGVLPLPPDASFLRELCRGRTRCSRCPPSACAVRTVCGLGCRERSYGPSVSPCLCGITLPTPWS